MRVSLEQAVDLAIARQEAREFEQAELLWREIVNASPRWVEAMNQLGIVLQHLGRHADAIEAFERALSVDPAFAPAMGNRATSLGAMGRFDEAIESGRRCAERLPESAEVWCNLGNLLRDAGRLAEAIEAYGLAVERNGALPAAHNGLGNALKDAGAIEEAIASYRRAVEIDPAYQLAWSNLLYALHLSPAMSAVAVYEEHVAWARVHADPLRATALKYANDHDAERKLRIGIVSPDLREHPVGRFIWPWIREHDRKGFEIVCYADVIRADVLSERICAHAASWVDSHRLTDAELFGRIVADRIDVLLDLAGHTAGNRLAVFARKPAPVQGTYLGYPGTTGMSAMDFRLTDAIADPAGADALSRERLIRLGPVAWCFDAPSESPDVADCDGDVVTFGCFNALAKVNREVIGAWARILDRVPGSRLMVKSHGATDAATVRRFAAISSERIEFRPPTGTQREHLSAYNEVDVALDPFPYCGTMSTCEALWMGTPVVTLSGKAHVSRVGLSLLSAVGLNELAARDVDEYVELAVALASDRERRLAIRRGLRERMRQSALMDADAFSRGIESALRTAWGEYCSGGQVLG